ncbi:MAG: hypothetical protein K9J04_03765 [Burkholderiales bacterium]|nr:hypothetical protein [Burkholderiales bacterium]
MRIATGLLATLVLAATMAVPTPLLAGAASPQADKPAAPKDIGPVRSAKPQYESGLKPKEEITQAEQLVFLDEHLSNIKSSTTLNYAFVKQGNMEKGFTDSVEEALSIDAKGKTVKARFLSGLNSKDFPPIEGALSNPVILHFLERDLDEMKRLTTGQPNYFRKRIRLALAEGPEIKPVKVSWNGKMVDARSVSVEPYMTDPNVHDPSRAAYKRYRGKRYTFILSDAVPGKVVEMRFTIPDLALAGEAAFEKPLLEEVLTIQPAKK